MALKESIHLMKDLMHKMNADLEKTVKGNKTAAQRVRTSSVQFVKVAKMFRKESVCMGKNLKKATASKKK